MIIYAQEEYSSLDRVVQNLPYQVDTFIVCNTTEFHAYYIYKVKDISISILLTKDSTTIVNITYILLNVQDYKRSATRVFVEDIRKYYISLDGFVATLKTGD